MKKDLIVGLDHAAPLPMHTAFAKGNFEGFEVDLLHRIADELNLQLDYKVAYWKDILNDLAAKKIDCICSAATVTKEREQQFLFSRPYLNFQLALVCNEARPYKLEDLANLRVGVRRNTEAEKYLLEKFPGKELIYFDSNEEIYQQLSIEVIDALIDDSPIAFAFSKDNPHLTIMQLLPGTKSQYAIMLRQENETLKTKIDGVLEQLESNGFMKQNHQKWLEGAHLED